MYDAWGNHKAFDGNGTLIYDSALGVTYGYATHLGNLNPFRYRSYVYDTETGLYALPQRYYDPQTGRFININSKDFGSLDTWRDIGISTAIGGIAGAVGGRGATHFKTLNKYALKNPTSAFVKASASYNKVLTKIAVGGYKNLAGAAGAKHLTRTALTKAWNQMVIGHAGRALTISLTKTCIAMYALAIGKGVLYNQTGW